VVSRKRMCERKIARKTQKKLAGEVARPEGVEPPTFWFVAGNRMTENRRFTDSKDI